MLLFITCIVKSLCGIIISHNLNPPICKEWGNKLGRYSTLTPTLKLDRYVTVRYPHPSPDPHAINAAIIVRIIDSHMKLTFLQPYYVTSRFES